MSDPVNHPAHYTSSPAKCSGCGQQIECIDITRHMRFNLGNVFKYVWRNGFGVIKGNTVEDLEKAVFYLEDEIRRLKANGSLPDHQDGQSVPVQVGCPLRD